MFLRLAFDQEGSKYCCLKWTVGKNNELGGFKSELDEMPVPLLVSQHADVSRLTVQKFEFTAFGVEQRVHEHVLFIGVTERGVVGDHDFLVVEHP